MRHNGKFRDIRTSFKFLAPTVLGSFSFQTDTLKVTSRLRILEDQGLRGQQGSAYGM